MAISKSKFIDPLSLLSSTTAATAATITTTTLPQLHQIHAHLVTSGLIHQSSHLHSLLSSSLSLSQNTPQHLHYHHQLISHPPSPPSIYSLNTLIRAVSRSPYPHLSFRFYHQILTATHIAPDNFTFNFLIRACTQSASLVAGQAVHASAVKRGFGSDRHVQSGLIHMYGDLGSPESAASIYSELRDPCLVTQTAVLGAFVSLGRIDRARRVFDGMTDRDPIAWNAMIAGYSHAGRSREALELFSSMQSEKVRVGEATMVSVLTACAHLGALDQGEWAHAYVRRNGLRMTVTLGTALIEMYSKCGDTERAIQVFWVMKERNVYTWSSAMSGLAMNGFGGQCLELFRQMKEQDVEPNGITFVSVLRGCSVAGLVDQGREHFEMMKVRYNIEPWPEHYGCMVDLYGRAGLLDDAFNVIKSMPIEPHLGAWGALLNACRIYKNIELGELAMEKMVELESGQDSAYVLLSNIYADSRNWKGVTSVRKLMKGRGVKKEPGCSVIEVHGEIHEFFCGDRTHPRYKEIEAMFEEISRRLRLFGYSAKTKEVLFDIEEEEKEDALSCHSEKIAIAFGLVVLEECMAIRIVKNLRICWDCHDVAKLISKAFAREIVVRDRNRFHRFTDGVCSCKDYW